MTSVTDEKITNKMVRRKFGNIPDMHNIIKTRKMKFLSHIVSEWKILCTSLSAWTNGKRPQGQPRCTALQYLHKLLPDHVNIEGETKTWIHFARDQNNWTKLLQNEIKPNSFPHQQNHNSRSTNQNLPSPPHFSTDIPLIWIWSKN